MAKIGTLTLSGCSGKKYQFNSYPFNTNFRATGAVYLISKGSSYIYLGITDDLSTRFVNHHKLTCFRRHNANCISVLLCSSKLERELIEKDILCNYNFLCNEVNN